MFRRSGGFIVHHPIVVILIWSLVTLASAAVAIFGIGGPTIFSQLETDKPSVPDSESDDAWAIMEESPSNAVTLLVYDIDLNDPATAGAIALALAQARPEVEAMAHVTGVTDPFQTPPDGWQPALPGTPYNAAYLAQDGSGFALAAALEVGLERDTEKDASAAVADRLEELGGELADLGGGGYVVSSSDLVLEEFNGFMESELFRAEGIALPAALVVLIIVFGGLLAALMPAIGAVTAILTGLGGMILINAVMELDSVIINVITIIGMGLSIDYGLLIVSRFREELHRLGVTPGGGPSRRDPLVRRAVQQTHATAGRTVTFSALTIAVCVLGLAFFKPTLLKGIAYGGAMAVVLAMLTATTFVPAVLVLLGHRFAKPSPLTRLPGVRRVIQGLGDVTTDQGFFARLAGWVQRFKWPVFAFGLALLVAAASLVGGLQMRSSSLGMLEEGMTQKVYYDELAENYPYLAPPDAYVVTTGAMDQMTAYQLAQDLGQVEHVGGVVGPIDLGASGGNQLFYVDFDVADSGGPEATAAVKAIRALGEPILVTGDAASQLDFKDSLIGGLPLAGALVVAAVFILLFLMTGSVVVPLKALIVNGLSILATLGLATWIFTLDHGFKEDGLEIYVVAVIVAFGFGLAMDYEVFLLDRIKEIYDTGESNDVAVSRGLQRSGRIITSAASVIIVVFLGFALGDLAPIRQVGLTLAILVALDATLVRMLLVPATMTILGRVNWWAPGPLQRFGRKFAIRHVD